MTAPPAAGLPSPRGGPARLPADRVLTARRAELLTMAANGMSNADIARALWVSEDTVKSHFRHIYTVLGAKDRAHAVALGLVRGFVRPDQVRLQPPRGSAA
ncbi:helix-turn-helix domain-containing protein [Streptomyces hygroscopicus]|uniref:helix-turn-helix domain-containing protein n=1 Tax=Streptomyces hygroscopicus TaxID=1912 RepID=UPI0033FB6CFE